MLILSKHWGKLNCWKAVCYFYKSGCFQGLSVLLILFLGLGILNGNCPFSTCFCQVDFSFYRSRCFLVNLFSPKHEAVTIHTKVCLPLDFICVVHCSVSLLSIPIQVFLFLNLICIQLSWYKGISFKPLEKQLASEKVLISSSKSGILSKVHYSFVLYEVVHSTTLKY